MKTRKGFGTIVICGKKFLFNWARTIAGINLIMYTSDDQRIEIPSYIWNKYPDSDEYTAHKVDVWHGKRKRGPEFGGWGKREAREMYFKYLRYIEDCGVILQ